MTSEDLRLLLALPGYRLIGEIGKPGAARALAPGLRHSEPQHHAAPKPLEADRRKAPGSGRFVVSIERRGIKILDADNAAGACKYVLDALRYAGVIPEDDPESIDLIVSQRKVRRKDIGTLLTIERLA